MPSSRTDLQHFVVMFFGEVVWWSILFAEMHFLKEVCGKWPEFELTQPVSVLETFIMLISVTQIMTCIQKMAPSSL